MKRVIYILIAFLGFSGALIGQESNILNSLDNVPQGYEFNPAKKSPYKWYMGIPALSSIGIDYTNKNLKYYDFLRVNAYDSLELRKDEFIDNLEDGGSIELAQSIEILRAGLKIDEHQFTFSLGLKNYQKISVSKELFDLALNGNAPFIGKNVTILDNEIDMLSYVEYALGYSTAIDSRWRVGGRVKLLTGLMNVTTKNSYARIFTDPEDYGINISTDFLVHASTPFSHIISDDDSGDQTVDLGGMFGNKGFAVDLGATFQPMPELELGVTVTDLGFINWSHNVKEIRSMKEDANFLYTGFELDDLFEDKKFNEDVLSDLSDSLKNELDIKEYPGESYNTMLRTRFILDGKYRFDKMNSLSAIWNSAIIGNRFRSSFAVNYNFDYDFVGFAVGNTIANNWLFNPGAAFYIRGGAFQFYTVVDSFSSMYLTKMRSMSVKFGFNLVFK
ncbi:MAG: DUF5723 family protein [Hyphomicrobiales bacterium]